MIKKLLDFFSPDVGDADFSAEDLPLASAVLLVEVARSDFEHSEAETEELKRLLRSACNVDEADIDDLLHRANAEADAAVALDRHVDLVNRQCSREQKYDLIKALWQVAKADGEVHHYEEHLVRRLADLLHVPHRDFIRSKHEAGSGS
jgi:uncharacterized tellurite resistance protein B-like protein